MRNVPHCDTLFRLLSVECTRECPAVSSTTQPCSSTSQHRTPISTTILGASLVRSPGPRRLPCAQESTSSAQAVRPFNYRIVQPIDHKPDSKTSKQRGAACVAKHSPIRHCCNTKKEEARGLSDQPVQARPLSTCSPTMHQATARLLACWNSGDSTTREGSCN